MLRSDHFFTGGVGHPICEDYALSGSFTHVDGEVFHYGIISDGCTQAPDTDFGSRILSIATKHVLKNIYSEEYIGSGNPTEKFRQIGDKVIQRGHMNTESLGLKIDCLSSTLLFVIQKEGSSKAYAVAFGDGFVYGIKGREVIIKKISYSNEAPFYLHYSLSPQFQKMYVDKFGGQKTIENWAFNLDASAGENEGPTLESENVFNPSVFEFDGFDYVGVASDGFDQIRDILENGHRNPLTYEHVFREALNIRNFNGEFVSRHLGFLVKRKWKNRELFDDISVAMIADVEENK